MLDLCTLATNLMFTFLSVEKFTYFGRSADLRCSRKWGGPCHRFRDHTMSVYKHRHGVCKPSQVRTRYQVMCKALSHRYPCMLLLRCVDHDSACALEAAFIGLYEGVCNNAEKTFGVLKPSQSRG